MLFKKKGQPTQTEQTLLSQAHKEIDGLMAQNIHIKIQFTAMDFFFIALEFARLDRVKETALPKRLTQILVNSCVAFFLNQNAPSAVSMLAQYCDFDPKDLPQIKNVTNLVSCKVCGSSDQAALLLIPSPEPDAILCSKECVSKWLESQPSQIQS